MAVVVGAGPPHANEQAADAGRASQFEIRKIELADVIDCIARGVRDFGRAPRYGMFFGAVYAIGGLIIVWAAFALDYPYLVYPFVMGFALFAPFGAAGTYEISRRLESGEPLSWSAILGSVWSRTGKELGWLALVSLWDVDAGVRELARCAGLGMKGAMIWGYPPDDRPYYSPGYDRLWAAAQDLDLPLSLHIVTGMGEESRVDFRAAAVRYMHLVHEVQRSISQLVLGGVLERFPRLRVVAAECDIAWLPHWVQRMDHANQKFGAMMDVPLTMAPSDYVRRQVWLTFTDDALGASGLQAMGADAVMWGSDFPHTDSTWPNSQAVLDKNLDGVPSGITARVLHDNAAELYHIPV